MKSIVHASAGLVAFMAILLFWMATTIVELTGSEDTIAGVKMLIPWGFLIVIPALAITGGSGLSLGRKYRGKRIDAKKRRTIIAAANGAFVLVPSALFLAANAQAGLFDGAFYAVQALELVAGATNLALLGLNIRDGLAMTGRFYRRRRSGPVNTGTN